MKFHDLRGCNGVSLVIELFALRQSNVHLHIAAVEVYLQGNNRIPCRTHLMVPLANLRLMQQKPSGAKRVFIKDIPLLVWADVHVVDESLSILNLDVAFLQAALTHAQTFYLCPCQRNACLYGFFNGVCVSFVSVERITSVVIKKPLFLWQRYKCLL